MIKSDNHLATAFAEPQTARLIPFIMTGDPSVDVTIDMIELLAAEGVVAIELGLPFSDPVADGPTIQAAGERALTQNISISDVLQVAKTTRERGVTVPLILCTYYNLLLQYGVASAVTDVKEAGFSGLIIPDLPFEESEELRELGKNVDLPLIPLVAPTSAGRISAITKQAQGFVYCVSSLGTTGERSNFSDEVIDFLQTVKKISPIPTAVGFGISKPEHVQTFSKYADAVIVGSALVKVIEQQRSLLLAAETRKEGLEKIRTFVRSLKSE